MGFELILIPPFLKPITLDLIVQERENVREFDRHPGPSSQIISLYERGSVFLII